MWYLKSTIKKKNKYYHFMPIYSWAENKNKIFSETQTDYRKQLTYYRLEKWEKQIQI